MPVTTTYPGVYVEELSTLSLSVANGANAVPAFATKDTKITSTTKISSWLDFTRLVGDFDNKNVLHVCMKTYFENGGGYCYLTPSDKLIADVPKYDDITLLVAAGQDIKSAVAQLCQSGKSLFAIYDGPKEELTSTVKDHGYDASAFAAVYYPWLTADWSGVDIPPSAAVAGIYCRNDREQGVWKAPANEILQGGVKPIFKVTDDIQGTYNKGKAINMLRTFPNTGVTVWGARTLEDTDNWRYIPVRRLFNTAEKDIKEAMSFAVFEPNNEPTWQQVRSAIESYLYRLWRQGGLAGQKETEAYFVQVGKDITMTEEDIKQGKMIVKIGIAAARPAEFIILQFTQTVGQI